MAEREIESGGSESGELVSLIDHWVRVIDDWVEQLDEVMGGTAPRGVDPAEACQPPDPPPGARLADGADVRNGMTA
jgi:hypothetical protein